MVDTGFHRNRFERCEDFSRKRVLMIDKCNYNSVRCLTNCKTNTERNISYCIHAAVDWNMSQVD